MGLDVRLKIVSLASMESGKLLQFLLIVRVSFYLATAEDGMTVDIGTMDAYAIARIDCSTIVSVS